MRIDFVMLRCLVVVQCLGVASSCATDDMSAASTDKLAAIRQSFKERCEKFSKFRWEMNGTILWPKGSRLDADSPFVSEELRAKLHASGGFPPSDVTYPHRELWIVDVAEKRFRHEITEFVLDQESLTFSTSFQVNAIDRGLVWTQSRHNIEEARNFIFEIRAPKQRTSWLATFPDFPVFLSHGLSPIDRFDAFTGFPTLGDVPSLTLVGTAEVARKNCVVVRIPTDGSVNAGSNQFCELYLDVEQNHVLVRAEFFDRDFVMNRVNILEWGVANGISIPVKWQSLHFRNHPKFGHAGELIEQVEFSVALTEYPEAFPPETFAIPLAPGREFYDHRDERRYVVAADGHTLVPMVLNTNVQKTAAKQQSYSFLITVNCILVAAAMVYLFVNRVKKT